VDDLLAKNWKLGKINGEKKKYAMVKATFALRRIDIAPIVRNASFFKPGLNKRINT